MNRRGTEYHDPASVNTDDLLSTFTYQPPKKRPSEVDVGDDAWLNGRWTIGGPVPLQASESESRFRDSYGCISILLASCYMWSVALDLQLAFMFFYHIL